MTSKPTRIVSGKLDFIRIVPGMGSEFAVAIGGVEHWPVNQVEHRDESEGLFVNGCQIPVQEAIIAIWHMAEGKVDAVLTYEEHSYRGIIKAEFTESLL